MLPEHIRYLREKAKQLRSVAGSYRSELARRLLDLADEFDVKATELEAFRSRDGPRD